MRTTLVTISLLLTALATLPGASAASGPCDLTSLGCDPVAVQCTPASVGVSCVYAVEGTNCMQVEWGVHQPGLVAGGRHTCNVAVIVGLAVGSSAAAPCDVSPTWPTGHATCTVAGKAVHCTFETGPMLVVGPDTLSCDLPASAAAAPCTSLNPLDTTCTTPAGSCTVFLNRWSYGGCETVLPCLVSPATVVFDRLTVHASDCRVGFDLIG